MTLIRFKKHHKGKTMEEEVHDRRAHERINTVEELLQGHLKDHLRFEAELRTNTALTQEIANNTSELVDLIKGAKAGGKILLWLSPILAALSAGWATMKGWSK